MNRREFIQVSCATCCMLPAAIVLDGCQPIHYVTGSLTSEGIVLSPVEFLDPAQAGAYYRKFIIVRHDQLEYPICLYRLSETDYSALLMQCTHQGTELQAGGDKLHCPAHGSEYDQRGKVTQGPSEQNLRTFPVVADAKRILIRLT